jgi:hypothetical protein
MITSSDSENTIDLGKYYAILNNPIFMNKKYKKVKKVEKNFSYNSGTNSNFLSIEELKKQIQNYQF